MSFLSRVKNLGLLLFHALSDFLFPKSTQTLALEALSNKELTELLPPPLPHWSKKVIPLFDYAHPLTKEIVWEIKYAGNKTLAGKLGAILYERLLVEIEEQNLPLSPAPVLLPVPMSGKRRFERGWNQAELLAEAMKKADTESKLKYFPGQLIKIVHTESQTQTSGKQERQHNLSSSMKIINPDSLKGRVVILVDDVVTTGSTFAEARRALKVAGVKKILCLAIAH